MDEIDENFEKKIVNYLTISPPLIHPSSCQARLCYWKEWYENEIQLCFRIHCRSINNSYFVEFELNEFKRWASNQEMIMQSRVHLKHSLDKTAIWILQLYKPTRCITYRTVYGLVETLTSLLLNRRQFERKSLCIFSILSMIFYATLAQDCTFVASHSTEYEMDEELNGRIKKQKLKIVGSFCWIETKITYLSASE